MKKIKLLCLSLVLIAVSCEKEEPLTSPISENSDIPNDNDVEAVNYEVVDLSTMPLVKVKDENVIKRLTESTKLPIAAIYKADIEVILTESIPYTSKNLDYHPYIPAFVEDGFDYEWYVVQLTDKRIIFFNNVDFKPLRYRNEEYFPINFGNEGNIFWEYVQGTKDGRDWSGFRTTTNGKFMTHTVWGNIHLLTVSAKSIQAGKSLIFFVC